MNKESNVGKTKRRVVFHRIRTVDDTFDFGTQDIPEGAIKHDAPNEKEINEWRRGARFVLFLAGMLMLNAIILIYVDDWIHVYSILDTILYFLAGCLVSFLTAPLRLMLQALILGCGDTIHVALVRKGGALGFIGSAPIRRDRFVTYVIVPFVIWLVPAIIALVLPGLSYPMRLFLYGLSTLGFTSSRDFAVMRFFRNMTKEGESVLITGDAVYVTKDR